MAKTSIGTATDNSTTHPGFTSDFSTRMFDTAEFDGGFAMFVTTSVFDDLSFLCDCLLRGCRLTCTRAFVRLDDEDDVFCAATTKPLLRRAFSLANITFSRRILRVFCVCIYVCKAKRRSCFGASFKTYSDCSDDRLSFSLSLFLSALI